MNRVVAALRGGRWWRLPELAETAKCSITGASARVRDLRKPRFAERFRCKGVEARHVGRGVWEYRAEFDDA